MQNKKIHFVCSGNVFRSRLATAYARALQKRGYEITSSGVHADIYPEIYLSPLADHISKRDGIAQWLDDFRKLSTQDDFDTHDIIVFMHPRVYEVAKLRYNLNEDKCLVWDVNDVEDWHKRLSQRQKEDRTATKIKQRVHGLFRDMERGSWVDIVDEHNRPRHFALPISIANHKKLWHRGCHALLTTPDKQVVVQKRSKRIVFSPQLIDITLGGHVDTRETPEIAMLRELQEEMGVTIQPDQLRLLEIYKQSRYHPRYKRHARSFTYTYHIPLSETQLQFTPERSEVSTIAVLTPNQAKRLVRNHRLRGLGKLNYTYAYYRFLLSELGIA